MTTPRLAVKPHTIVIALPHAEDELGRWVEQHGASITLTCMMGNWCCSVGWKKLHSYSDNRGQHSEHWDVSRRHRKPEVAFARAVTAAMAIDAGEPLPKDES